jgi:hypothetical protein
MLPASLRFRQPRGGNGKWFRWVIPCPLSHTWGQRTGDSSFNKLFSILFLLPLFTVLQGGDREFIWSGFPLMVVLTHAKVGTSDVGQTLLMTNILVLVLHTNHLIPIKYLQSVVFAT